MATKQATNLRRVTLHLCFAVIGGVVAVYITVIVMHTLAKPWLAQNPVALPPGSWTSKVPADWPARPDQHYHTPAPLTLLEQNMAQRGDLSYSLTKFHIGWPFPICHNRRQSVLMGFTVVQSQSDWRLPWVSMIRRFPGLDVTALRPSWPGFGIVWTFFAGVILVCTVGVPASRRALRRRRGLCVHCGYEGAGQARCPECGRAGDAVLAG